MAYGIKANVSTIHKFLRTKSLCWVHNFSGSDRIKVVGMSKRGRRVITWVDPKILSNFRVGWIANEPPFQGSDKFPFETKELAEKCIRNRFSMETVK